MDILEKLFGSAAKVKIMRLFLFNQSVYFDLETVAERAKISPPVARTNIKTLEEIGLIKPRTFIKDVKVESPAKKGKKAGKMSIAKKRVGGWILNETFPYLPALHSFLIHVSPLQDDLIIKKFNRTGKIKLLILSGVFLQEKDSRVDIFIVGDSLRRSAIDSTVKEIESELGKDLTYSYFDTKDFQYRLTMYDKLVRDILDYPHKKLINKLAIQNGGM